MVEDNIEEGYAPILVRADAGYENRTTLLLTIGACGLLALFLAAIYTMGYLFSKKMWL
jgi:hypothetical protein